jgi:hypothetical protein
LKETGRPGRLGEFAKKEKYLEPEPTPRKRSKCGEDNGGN